MKSPLAVNLNVGGSEYKVSRLTLRRYPDSMLAKLVSAPWTSEESSEAIFVDRDGPTRSASSLSRPTSPTSVCLRMLISERAVMDLNDLAARTEPRLRN